MSKKEQERENEKVIQWYNAVKISLNGIAPAECRNLRYCSASVKVYDGVTIYDEYGNTLLENETVYLLVSYYTPVAFVVESMNFGVDMLRLVYGYTATSSQHIAKFFKDYLNEYYNPYTIRYK